ncbi:hypothetical protein B9Y25_08120 [Acinetobacter baumannii]|uniref:hypothetical protein n=1 Tax=Acinetobacter baumannii TaxID=470 RepID=UPI0003DEF515|nr:hypothetical protein [Acinetobacter baumannii]ETQ79187.1 hypothetical protein P667_1739 [Acinetobacter baumannii UH5107]OTL64900.1 hypothetical protein B9Y25_08120 [Acinetobacter baumannii]
MKYFVLSATQSSLCPISLVDDAVLYMNKEQASQNIECGSLPWYSYKTSKNCDLPIEGVLILKSKKIEISIRNINENIYVVDEIFKNIFGKYINSDFIRVEVLSESLEKINNKNYYIFRFNQIFDFKNVLDLNKSTYRLDNDFLVLEKAEFLSDLDIDILKIDNMDSAQDTFFISEFVKKEIEKNKYQGINILELTLAQWRDSDDFSFMFLSEDEVNKFVWPI